MTHRVNFRRIARYSFLVAVSIFTVLSTYQPVLAVESGGVGGRPGNPDPLNSRTASIFIYTLEPGDIYDDSVVVYNNSDNEKTIRVYPVDSTLGSGGSFACKQRAEARVGVGSWIKMSSSSVTLGAGESQKVPFTVTVPETASVGEQDGCIAIEEDAQDPVSNTGGVVINTRSAIRLAVTVPGELTKKLSYTHLTTQLKNTKLLLALGLKNEGNVSVDADLSVELRTLVGDVMVRKAGGGFPVLPGTSSDYSFEVDRPLFGGWYRLVATTQYNADANAVMGETGVSTAISRSETVFVPPTLLGLVIDLFALAGLLALGYWVYRKLNDIRIWRGHAKPYRVKEGDTIESVAAKHNLRWKELAHHNKIKPPYVLEPGIVLQVLKRSKKRVRRGKKK